jgi:mannose-6-phosphate isomerase-like protein (cupin superfamily)
MYDCRLNYLSREVTMAPQHITVDEFERTRVARFDELESSSLPLLDAVIPGCERNIYNIIGRGMSEDATHHVPITDNQGFNMAIVECEPGKGTLHHDHKTIEAFMPLNGTWKIFWGDDEDTNTVTIGKFDVVSVPIGIMRGFRNVGDEKAMLMVTVGGTDPGKCGWHESVVADAADRGYKLGDDGNIIKVDAAE